MPIYEYRCGACGHYLEALQKVSDGPLTDCPQCEESALKRLISAPSFRLKGSGWYETDFKSDKERKRNLAETASADAGEKKDSGDKAKEPSKPDAKADSKPKESAAESKKPASKPKGSGTEAA